MCMPWQRMKAQKGIIEMGPDLTDIKDGGDKEFDPQNPKLRSKIVMLSVRGVKRMLGLQKMLAL